ncbi:hypothetical protein CBOM_07040 [Ceraceosorus bombacis]|uniref:Lipoprotein n=1 Tax=Ceraceosorus bombacis TaxID=401625 RepID=A0A0P1BK86_9BASI|nr:hypothetical protein CBOM_07040 [Ceraceosorus bombacis]
MKLLQMMLISSLAGLVIAGCNVNWSLKQARCAGYSQPINALTAKTVWGEKCRAYSNTALPDFQPISGSAVSATVECTYVEGINGIPTEISGARKIADQLCWSHDYVFDECTRMRP